MPMYLIRLILCVGIGCLLLLTACSGKKETKPPTGFNPETSLAEADKLVNDEKNQDARKILLEVKNRDTAKKYGPLAQIKIADSYMREGEFDTGIEEYRKFLELYPDNQYASYAQYQIAMAYFRQIESPDMGPGFAQKALQEFQKLKEQYPRNPYREVVELRIQKCKDIIADSEFLVGKFYFNKGSYDSAIDRFEGLLKSYPTYRKRDEVLLLLARSYRAFKIRGKVEEYVRLLQTEYPDSKYTTEAQKLLR